MIFEIVKTSIINVTADAIVLPANEELKEGSGVSTAIFAAAGRKKLTQACAKLKGCKVGSAVPTLAFNLKAKYIIHTVVPKWIDGEHDEYNLLGSAYVSALNIADLMGCETIAFPLLASGNNGFEMDIAFEIAKKSIESFDNSNLKKVILVVYDQRIAELVQKNGHSIIEIPVDIHKQALRAEHQAKVRAMKAEGKEIALKFMEDQIATVLKHLKDEKTQKRIIEIGGQIARTAMTVKKTK